MLCFFHYSACLSSVHFWAFSLTLMNSIWNNLWLCPSVMPSVQPCHKSTASILTVVQNLTRAFPASASPKAPFHPTWVFVITPQCLSLLLLLPFQTGVHMSPEWSFRCNCSSVTPLLRAPGWLSSPLEWNPKSIKFCQDTLAGQTFSIEFYSSYS